MVCLYCGGELAVINSRHQKKSNHVWRRRQCSKCLAKFTSYESIDMSATFAVKQSSGKLSPFSKEKIFTEVLLALQDRPKCYQEAAALTETVIAKLVKSRAEPVLSTSQISTVAAETLKRFDKRAYLRFQAEHPSLL